MLINLVNICYAKELCMSIKAFELINIYRTRIWNVAPGALGPPEDFQHLQRTGVSLEPSGRGGGFRHRPSKPSCPPQALT